MWYTILRCDILILHIRRKIYMEYKIISDGSCDLSDDLVEKYNIDVIPFYVSFNGVDYQKEKEEVKIRDFYQRMIDNPKVFPKSSLPAITDYEEAFRKYAEEGKSVICICITTKFSGSYNSATNARDMVLEDYPEAKIEIIDSTLNTVLEGLFVIEAGKMQQAGLSFEENVNYLNKIKSSGRILFTIGSLDYLKNGGRIGKVAGVAGSALGLRPVIIMKEGEIFTGGLARSRKKSLAKVLEQISKHFESIDDKIEDYAIAVGFGYDYEEAVEFRKQVYEVLDKKIPIDNIIIQQIGATVGVHTGPLPLGIGLIHRYDTY